MQVNVAQAGVEATNQRVDAGEMLMLGNVSSVRAALAASDSLRVALAESLTAETARASTAEKTLGDAISNLILSVQAQQAVTDGSISSVSSRVTQLATLQADLTTVHNTTRSIAQQ